MDTEPATITVEKPVMLVAIDESEHSFYALEWTLDHFFVPHAPNFPFDLIVIHAKPSPAASIGYAGPEDVLMNIFDLILKENAQKIAEFLASHPRVKKAKGAGSVLCFITGCGALQTWSVKSLINMPVFMSHSAVPATSREAIGLTKDLVRISMEIEDVNNLISDLDNALKTGPL